MTKFIFVRHGETDYKVLIATNLESKLDFAPLSNEGVEQVNKLLESNELEGAQALICSPFTRTMQTASIISNKLALPLNVEINLHEWNPDIAGAYTAKDMIANPKLVETIFYKAVSDYRKGDFEDKEYESLIHVKERVLAVLKQYLNYDKVIVVLHSSIMSIFSEKEHKYATTFEYEFDS